jgi:hypothetical protein
MESLKTIKPIIKRIHDAGLNIDISETGGLSVSPASRLTDDLRAVIREHRNDLVQLLTPCQQPGKPVGGVGSIRDAPTVKVSHWHPDAPWRILDREYLNHHVNCAQCKCAGQGRGLRCGTGAALWTGYINATKE